MLWLWLHHNNDYEQILCCYMEHETVIATGATQWVDICSGVNYQKLFSDPSERAGLSSNNYITVEALSNEPLITSPRATS